MDIRKIPVEQINPAPYNPRVDLQPGDPEYEKLKRSIKEFGYIDPIIWNERTGNMVGGHQRYKILMEENPSEIVVSVVDLDDTQEKALNVALNKIGGEFDMPKLQELLSELDSNGYDVTLTGFDGEELEEVLASLPTLDSNEFIDVEEDDFDEEEALANIKEPVTKPGDIWQLGPHRLICGDSTDISVVERLMDGCIADMIFTDPPYNVDYEGKTEDALTIKNDKMDDESFYNFLYDAYTSIATFVKVGGAIYVCHADSESVNFRTAMKDAGFLLKQCIIWVKNTIVMGRQDYHWQHEPILYGWKAGGPHSWHGDRKQSTVWFFDKPLRNAEHPTMKPVGIPAKAIQNSSAPGEIVLDTFGGSGPTLIAAEKTGRIAYLCDDEPKYCDVIVRRWEEYTGQTAKRIPYVE